MRPRRRAAVKAAAAVARPLSPSPISSDEEDLNLGFDAGENEVFSEEDEMDDDDEDTHNIIDTMDLESLSEQEEDNDQLDEENQVDNGEEDEEEDNEDDNDDDDNNNEDDDDDDDNDEEEEEEEEEEQTPAPRKTQSRNNNTNNKRKKQVEFDSDEDDFSDDAEVLRNKPMTKRQRAKAYHEIPEEYLELPMDTGKKKMLTEEEEQLKKSEVARRRKNQSIQRAEKDKADTINRLLKKQASKSKRIIDDTEDKETAHEKLKRQEDPNRIRYVNTSKGGQLNIPAVYTVEHIFGDNSSIKPPTREIKKCQVEGCSKDRKYTIKNNGKYVCSLEHYKLVESN